MTITAKDIIGVAKSVTKEWERARKSEERGRRSREARMYVYSDRVSCTEVADDILPAAYMHASGDGQYTVSKRQFFYACREQFREQTDRELEYGYFAGTLLVQYMNRHPETDEWKITADPRGTLTIPNAGDEVRIPCGTIQIDNHLQTAEYAGDPMEVDGGIDVEWPSLAPGERYQGVLYIEKEGFSPLLKEAQIAERFDLAILSCKGQSVVAARKFVDHVCSVNNGVPLFVVHDLDKAGFEISQCLTEVSDWARANDRVTYHFQNQINVIDLGLRLGDVEEYGLLSESCNFKGGFASNSICTKAEKEFLRSGQRVELNAFTSPQFIKWLEGKLSKHLPRRLIPDDDVLENAYRRALVIAEINHAVEEAESRAKDQFQQEPVPKTLRRKVSKEMKDNGGSWDGALYRLAKTKVEASERES